MHVLCVLTPSAESPGCSWASCSEIVAVNLSDKRRGQGREAPGTLCVDLEIVIGTLWMQRCSKDDTGGEACGRGQEISSDWDLLWAAPPPGRAWWIGLWH